MNAIRALCFNCWFVGLTLVLGVVGLGVRLFARHRALDLARLWVRLTLGGMRVLTGVRVVVLGRANLQAGAQMIVSQHRSAFDTLVWLTLVDRPSYVMKQELRRIPLVGALLVPAGMIPIDRSAGASALRALLRDGRAALEAGRQVVIFPEGTRVAPGAQATLAPGIVALAASAAAPLLPVATNSGEVWGRGAFFRMLGNGSTGADRVIHIAIGPPLVTARGRAAMIPAIEAAWREGEAAIARARPRTPR